MAKPKWPTEEGVYLFVELYNLNVWLFTENKYYQKAMLCVHGEKDTTEVAGLTTYSVHKDGTNIFVLGVFDNDSGTLVHELAHVTLFMCEHIGFDPQEGNGEPFAYLQEYLYTKLLPYVLGDAGSETSKADEDTKEEKEKT